MSKTAALLFASLLTLAACGKGPDTTTPTAGADAAQAAAAQPAATTPNHPFAWAVDPARSTLTFDGSRRAGAITGRFAGFSAEIILDPANPAAAGSIRVRVPVAGITTGDSDVDQTLPSTLWFDASTFPEAVFTSTDIRPVVPGAFEAYGVLALRGVEKSIVLPFTLVEGEGGRAVADGSVVLNRQDFGVGQGDYAKPEDVGVEVTVRFHVEAMRAGN